MFPSSDYKSEHDHQVGMFHSLNAMYNIVERKINSKNKWRQGRKFRSGTLANSTVCMNLVQYNLHSRRESALKTETGYSSEFLVNLY